MGAYKEIIEGPAKRRKINGKPMIIQPALTEKLLEDIGKGSGKDALPLLAFTLERLYLEYGGDGDLSLNEYNAMAGIKGAIDAAVEQAFQKAEQDPHLEKNREQLHHLLRRGFIPWLAGIDQKTKAPRRRVAKRNEIPQEARSLIDHLIEQRLLATDMDEKTRETTVEPIHDALLRQWAMLQGWLKDDLPVLAILDGVQSASSAWEANKRDLEWLNHRGGRLEETEQIKERDDLAQFLNPSDWNYLTACREQERQQKEHELEEARKLAAAQKKETEALTKVAHRTKIAVAILSVILAIAGMLWLQTRQQNEKITFQNQQIRQNLTEAKHNLGLALFEKASFDLDKGTIDRAHLFFLHALRNLSRDKDEEKRAISAGNILSLPVINGRSRSPFPLQHEGNITTTAYSADGLYLATGGSDHYVRIWGLTDNRLIRNISVAEAPELLEFSADSKQLAVGLPHSLVLLTTETGTIMANWPVPFGESQIKLVSLERSSNPHEFFACYTNGLVQRFSATNRDEVQKFDTASVRFRNVTFSTDDHLMAQGNEKGELNIFNLTDGRPLAHLLLQPLPNVSQTDDGFISDYDLLVLKFIDQRRLLTVHHDALRVLEIQGETIQIIRTIATPPNSDGKTTHISKATFLSDKLGVLACFSANERSGIRLESGLASVHSFRRRTGENRQSDGKRLWYTT